MKDGVTHGYIIIIVIIRADTKRFTQRQCKKLTSISKLSRKKVMSKILVILDTKNWCLEFWNRLLEHLFWVVWLVFGWFALIFGWFGWLLAGLSGFRVVWLVSDFSNNGQDL